MAESREISDATTMRALAHPTRLALIELMGREGEMTATRAAEMLGDSPGNMSWHLQTLAKYGYVEEAGTGKGRSRPWKLASPRFSVTARPEDPGAALAENELVQLILERGRERQRQWFAARGTFPADWDAAAFVNEILVYVTSAELRAISGEIAEIFERHGDRTADKSKRPADALPVYLSAYGHPLPPTESGN
ncbi:MAG: helix-turn-helix domain-containing protein [Conexibacteraceae bacterium]|nr:helix-turn-helix domain-containing protein [Conexibacteraceae bacterium]